MLLDKLVAAGIGDRPVVFVTHRFVQKRHPSLAWFSVCSDVKSFTLTNIVFRLDLYIFVRS